MKVVSREYARCVVEDYGIGLGETRPDHAQTGRQVSNGPPAPPKHVLAAEYVTKSLNGVARRLRTVIPDVVVRDAHKINAHVPELGKR